METAEEERLRSVESLRKLEEAAQLLEDTSKSQSADELSTEFPQRLSGILNSLTAIGSREEAEQLLATGVCMWNAVIKFEGREQSRSAVETLIKVRHVAVDCMHMSTDVLEGISARYSIDGVSLLKFYTVCGQKYANDLGNMAMAEVCFSRAAEYVEAALNDAGGHGEEKTSFSSAMFDLLLGRAECAWEKGESDVAERFVSDAHQYMDDLGDEHEVLASVEYNFGLYAYEAKDSERALKWLKRSMATRSSKGNCAKDLQKQAKTARLAGVCLLALQEYEESREMMLEAEEMSHDPIGAYLLLKLSMINKKPDARDLLLKMIADTETSLDICIAAIALFGDAQRISDAAIGYEQLFLRYRDDPEALVSRVGMKHFETLAAMDKIDDALLVLKVCREAFEKLRIAHEKGPKSGTGRNSNEEDFASCLSKWSALLLATGCAQADGKKYSSAARLLNSCLMFSRSCQMSPSAVVENEAAICRLASSCALYGLEELQKRDQTALNGEAIPRSDDESFKSVTKEALWKLSLDHSQRAKHLEPNDFAPRLLLFRTYLASGEVQRAADELRLASSEISTFDPGALAEAACAARDADSMPSVVAALRCILKMDPTALSRNSTGTSFRVSKGFFGKVLVSCVHILTKVEETAPSNAAWAAELTQGAQREEDRNAELQDVLSSGLNGVQKLGADVAFGEDNYARTSLTYLADICWNRGRQCGMDADLKSVERYFDLCYGFSALLPMDASLLHTMRVSKLMCASANVENPDSCTEHFVRARQQVAEARQLSQQLGSLSPRSDEDPIDGLLLLLDARCCVGSEDVDALEQVVDTTVKKGSVPVSVVEQLAAICYTFGGLGDCNANGNRARCMDFTCALLERATNDRLCESPRDIGAIAMSIREHLVVELSRGGSPGRGYQVFGKAVGIVMENSAEFPDDERRWLIATGWDRALMYKRLGLGSEARRWCEGVERMSEGCMSFSTYTPRIKSLLESLQVGLN